MKWPHTRRLATLAVACAVLLVSAAPALAQQHRWAPSSEIEGGAYVGESASHDDLGSGDARATVGRKGLIAKNPPIEIKSPSAVLMEARSGRVLYAKNPHERRNPASVTKIMTLIIAFDAIRAGKVKPSDEVVISEEAAKQIGTIIFADTGETFSLADLLRSVAVGSANDAAVAVAEHVAGSVEAFVELMNAKAKELGMHDTQFRNPTGLSAEGHFTSAYDIALMSRYAVNQYPELVKLTAIYGDELKVPWRRNGPVFQLWNNNKLLTWYPGADGLKTGWTEAAGYCLAATAKRKGVRMISVIMGAESWKIRNAEAAKLLDHGFSNYTAVELAPKEKAVGKIRVVRGKQREVSVVPRDLFAVSVAKGEEKKVRMETRLELRVEAPVRAGQKVGEAVALLDGKAIARVDLVTAQAVPKANLWEMLLFGFRDTFSLK